LTGRRLRFVERRSEVRAADGSTDIVVLDTWWTPLPDERPDVLPLRPVVERILAREDLLGGSLERLDAWASAAGLVERFAVVGATWWYRIRMAVRWDAHELLVWLRVLAEVAPAGRYATIEVPAGRTALARVARARVAAEDGPSRGFDSQTRVVAMSVGADPRSPYRGLRRALRGVRIVRSAFRSVRALGPSMAAHKARVDARIAGLVADPPRVLAIAWAGAFQVIRKDGRDRRMDPYLTLVLDRLEAEGSRVAIVVQGLDHQRLGDWSVIADDERIVPDSIIDGQAWDGPSLGAEPNRLPFVAGSDPPKLEVDGVDLGPAMEAAVDGYAGRWLEQQRLATRRAERFLKLMRPEAIYLDREGTRTRWIIAARRLGIPVVAIQHGMIYPGNPEYCQPAHPLAMRPDVTCVFGAAERAIVIEQSGYAPDAVLVTGSPRSDPETMSLPTAPDERATVRRELGVAKGDRLLLISVAHNQVLGDLYSVAMVARLLGGPLPGVHIVVKIHPQDRGEADYVRLLSGLAEAGGYPRPAVSQIRDVDLYRLLRSADAHLGEYSTVLTDAVVVGTPNMIALGQAFADPLGYVAARVAVPVRTAEDVRSFMADPRPPEAGDRTRFLEQHFLPGDAIGRIVAAIGAVGSGSMPNPSHQRDSRR
jgi:hypothetical protein